MQLNWKAKREAKKYEFKDGELKKVETPNCTTIEDVANFLSVSKEQTIKAVIKKAIFKDKSKIVVFFVRGSDELEETKAVNSIDALELIDATSEDIKDAGLVAGYCGPNLEREDFKFIIDNELKSNSKMVCGANEENFHRIIKIDETRIDTGNPDNSIFLFEEDFADLVAVQEGDICSCCGGKLSYTKGIEEGMLLVLEQLELENRDLLRIWLNKILWFKEIV